MPSPGSPASAIKSVYGADLDGNEFEIMWMLPRNAWREFENAAPVERLELDAELARWAGVRTAGRIISDADANADTKAGTRTEQATS